jgi:hypothetical protein
VYLPLQQRPIHCTSQTLVRSIALTSLFYQSQGKNTLQARLLTPLHSQICVLWNLILQRHKAFLPQCSSLDRIVPQLEEGMILIGEKEKRNGTVRILYEKIDMETRVY